MRLLHTLILLIIFSPIYSQVTGRLTDAFSGEPIEGGIIISDGEASISGVDGSFIISSSGFISIQATGYRGLTFKADTLMPMIVRLEPINYNLSEVSVTAFYTPSKLRTVAGAVSTISINPAHAVDYNIVSSLTSSPGVYVQQATPGTMKLTLRGIGSRYPYGTKKMKMYFDEIPLYSAEGETSFDDINPENIARIDVLRGPASGIYGASLGGAVILYPKRPEYGKTEFQLNNSVGSFGYFKNSAAYSAAGRNSDLLVSITRIQSDGYRENSNYKRGSFMVNYNHQYANQLTGTLLLLGSSIEAQIPSSIDSATYYSNPKSAALNWLQTQGNKTPDRILAGYKMKYRPSSNWDFTTSVFTTLRRNEENRPFNFLNESGISYGGRFLAVYSGTINQVDYNIIAGSNLFFENYKSAISANPGGIGTKGALQQEGHQWIYQSDIFSQAEFRFSNLTFTGGFDVNKSGFTFNDVFSSDTIDQSGLYSFRPVFSPRLGFSWDLIKEMSLYAAINRGFTIPSLSETQTPLGLINREIKPEKAWSYELGTRVNIFRDATFIDLAFYYMKVSNLIVPKRVEEDFYVGMNAGASLHRGIEVALQQLLWGRDGDYQETPFSAVLNLSYSMNKFNFLEFIEDENDFSGNQLPGMPEHFLKGSIDMKFGNGFFSHWELISSGKIPLDDFNLNFTNSWMIMNAGTGYTFNFKGKFVIEGLIKFNNITNKRYASMVVVNAPGTESRPPRYYYPGMPLWGSFSLRIGYCQTCLTN